MMALCFEDQIVQQLEIAVVVCKQHAIFPDHMPQMNGVVATGYTDIGGKKHVVPGPSEKSDEDEIYGIVVKV